MTTRERVNALIESVEYIVSNNIEGDFVECGVWRGGSSMAMAYALQEFGDTSRKLYLYDTYTGMSMPTSHDVTINGEIAAEKFSLTKTGQDSSEWCEASLEEVQQNMQLTGYPSQQICYVKGKVEETLSETVPEKIAILRLDTDWYESTMQEMIHLFPRLVPNGILILDDYGHWEGARKAVDEYIAKNKVPIFLFYIDYSGRIAIKPS